MRGKRDDPGCQSAIRIAILSRFGAVILPQELSE